VIISSTRFFTQSQAAHIMGGLGSYKVKEIDMVNSLTTLTVEFTLYRDRNGGGANLDDPSFVALGVYRKMNSGEYEFVTAEGSRSLEVFEAESNPLNPSVSIEYGVYTTEITLAQGSDYLIAYQRCCRSSIISNLQNAGELGFSLQLEITSLALENDLPSPRLTELPFTIAPLNDDFEFKLPLQTAPNTIAQMGLTDFYVAGGNFVQGPEDCCDCIRPDPMRCIPSFEAARFITPYTSESPFGPENNISMNLSGTFSGQMNVTGSYQYGMEIRSFLNGELLSKQILDYNLISALVSSTEEQTEVALKVYPNPSSGYLIVETKSSSPHIYELVDITGSTVQSGNLSQSARINLETPSGIYYLKVIDLNTGDIYSKKISAVAQK